MLLRHKKLWDGHLGEINVTEHLVDLLPEEKPFKSALYLAGPKKRELIEAEVEQQL